MPLERKKLEYAIRQGHFELTPKYHVTHAVMINQVFRDEAMLEEAAGYLMQSIPDAGQVTALVAGAPCGDALAHFAAAALCRAFPHTAAAKIVSVRDDDIRSPWEPRLAAGDRCVILHERALTGKVLARFIAKVNEAGAEVFAIAVLCDRRVAKERIHDIPTYAAYDLSDLGENIDLESGADCPSCLKNQPLTTTLRVI